MVTAEFIQRKCAVAAMPYSSLAFVTLTLCFALLEPPTPRAAIWEDLVEAQDVAAAIFVGFIAYGRATIPSSESHG